MAVTGSGEKRRLAAALAVELAGFTDRVARSGAGAAGLAGDIRTLIEGEIAASGGRLEDYSGDVATARFDSAGSALGSARVLLQRIAERNAALPEPINIRAGIHLAEFVEDHGRLSGPESSLALHIARLADVGGMTLTEPVMQQLQGQVALRGVYLPRRALRRIPGAPRVFAVPPASARYMTWAAARGGYWRNAAMGVVVLAVLVAAGLAARKRFAPPLASPAPVPVPAVVTGIGRLVNGYDTPQRIYQYAGGSSTVFWDIVPEGVTGHAMHMTYRLNAGGEFWGVATQVDQNWSSFDRIRFSLRAVPPTVVRIEIVEGQQERWNTEITAGTEWQVFELPFSGFQARTDFNSGQRNGTLDLGMISAFVISTTTPGSGAIWVDELTVASGSASRPGDGTAQGGQK
jgi:hypothetical protein